MGRGCATPPVASAPGPPLGPKRRGRLLDPELGKPRNRDAHDPGHERQDPGQDQHEEDHPAEHNQPSGKNNGIGRPKLKEPAPPAITKAMYTALALVVLAGLLGPLLASGRRFRVPVLTGELIGGIILGRTGLNLIDPTMAPFPIFSSLGFALLMLESGTEIDLGSRMVRDTAVRAGLAFFGTLLVAIPAGLLIGVWAGSSHA